MGAVVELTDACIVILVVVSAGHEYVGGARCSGNVSSTTDMLEMTDVHWMRGVGGV